MIFAKANVWEQRELGNVSDVIGGGTPSTNNSEYWNGDIDWYSPVEIGERIYVSGSQKKITKLGLEKSSAKILPVGTVLFTSRAGIGNTAILAKEGCTNQGFQSIIPHENKLDSYFIYSRTHDLKRYGEVTGAGSTFVEVSGKQMAKMPISLPKINEQRKIGGFFKELDSLITLHQRECDLLVKTKKSYLQKMFPKNGEDKPEIRFAGFTDAWEQREFGELLKEFSIKSKVEDEHTVLSSTNSGMEVRDGRVSGTSNLGYKIIENGDLVLSPQNLWIGNINVNDIGIGLVSPSYKTFKFVSVFGSFIEPQLRMPRLMEKYKNASTQGASVVRRNLELDSFYQITIRVPKSDEQRKIGDFFRQLDDLITLHQRELDSLKNMKKSLLQQMFI